MDEHDEIIVRDGKPDFVWYRGLYLTIPTINQVRACEQRAELDRHLDQALATDDMPMVAALTAHRIQLDQYVAAL